MINNQEKYNQEDEIDLRELWQTIINRKRFIFVFTSIITIAAIIWAYTKTPIYEVKSNVQFGFIGEKLLDEPGVIAKNVKIYFEFMDIVQNKEEFISEVTEVSQPKKLKNFITIKTQALSNEESLKRNKEVVKYLQSLYQNKINQYKLNTNNNINNLNKAIYNINNLEVKNIQEQIKIIKKQKIVKIDDKIKRLKEQEIVDLKNQITLLETQDIVRIDEKIMFINKQKIAQLDSKIDFTKKNLLKYNKSIEALYIQTKDTKNTTLLTVSALQMTNYQNLILNSQNNIEDLKLEKEKLVLEVVPNLKREKKNITDIKIRALKLKIDNINDVTIVNLQREKLNIENDLIRKLNYKLLITLPNKISKINEQIEELKFNVSDQNIQNSKVIGDYIINDYPVKPKKKLIVVVAFITGFILSIFIVFFLSFLSNNNISKEDEQSKI